MKRFPVILALGALLAISCSPENEPVKPPAKVRKDKISGVSQKGPLDKGSIVKLSELDSNLAQMGSSFDGRIVDDKGTFEIENIEIASPYAALNATGYYRNEVSGKKSVSQITLLAIADVEDKSSVNVNILTHLEYDRVRHLVGEGKAKTIAEAKKQAQKEILGVFGISGVFADSEDMSIFGESESDAALLAISILLQRDLAEADFSSLLAGFSLDIKESGKWSGEIEQNSIADWASGADLGELEGNILAWGLSASVPKFGKYVHAYWSANYKLGACDSDAQGSVKKNGNAHSTKKDLSYVCDGGLWREQEARSSSSVEQSSSSSAAEPGFCVVNGECMEMGLADCEAMREELANSGYEVEPATECPE